MSANIFEYQYTVQASDLDELNHVNNVVYLKWVQEASMQHWLSATKTVDVSAYVWVVGRHEIDYLRQTFLGDELTIKTWIGESEGSLSIRYVEVYRGAKLVCKSKTHWRFLSAETFKPTTIPEYVLNLFR